MDILKIKYLCVQFLANLRLFTEIFVTFLYGAATLKELILVGTNFGEIGEFRQNSPKLVPTKIKYFAHSPK